MAGTSHGSINSHGQGSIDNARLAAAALAAVVVAFAAFTTSSGRQFDPVVDGWLQGGGYVLCALLAGATVRHRREIDSRLVALSIGLRALGFVLFLTVIRSMEAPPYPSLADAAWLSMYLPLTLALVRLARARPRPLPPEVRLDALSAGAMTVALGLVVVPDIVRATTEVDAPTATLLTNAAYPLLDMVLLVLVATVLITHDWRPSRSVWLLSLGVAGFAVVDVAFLTQVVHGTFRPGVPIAAASLASTAAVTVSLLAGPIAPDHRPPTPRLVGPFAIGGAGVSLIAAAGYADLAGTSVAMAALGLVFVAARVRLTIATYVLDRREAIDGLRASQRQLNDAQRIAHVGSIQLLLPDRTLSWTDELPRILGLPSDTMPAGERLLEAVHPDDREGVLRAWIDAVEEGAPYDGLFRIVRPDGGERHIHGRAGAEIDPAGAVRRVTFTSLDVTEQVANDERRLTAEHRLAMGFEQSAVPSVMAGLDGVPTAVNPAMCEFMGRPLHDLVGQRWAPYAHPDDPPFLEALLESLAEGNNTFEAVRRFIRPDGSLVWASFTVSLVRDARGQPDFLLGHIIDITARKAAEQRTEETQRRRVALLHRLARAEDAERDRIALDIHDNAIQRMAAAALRVESLARQLANQTISEPEAQARLEDVAGAVQAATRSLRELVYNLAAPDLTGGVAEALDTLQRSLFQDTSTMATVSGTIGPLADSVSHALYRVAAEALRNIARHADASTVNVELRTADGWVEVTIDDDGVGVPADGPTSAPGHLGVRTMRERAESIGGSCEIRPRPGGGTSVVIRCPTQATA